MDFWGNLGAQSLSDPSKSDQKAPDSRVRSAEKPPGASAAISDDARGSPKTLDRRGNTAALMSPATLGRSRAPVLPVSQLFPSQPPQSGSAPKGEQLGRQDERKEADTPEARSPRQQGKDGELKEDQDKELDQERANAEKGDAKDECKATTVSSQPPVSGPPAVATSAPPAASTPAPAPVPPPAPPAQGTPLNPMMPPGLGLNSMMAGMGPLGMAGGVSLHGSIISNSPLIRMMPYISALAGGIAAPAPPPAAPAPAGAAAPPPSEPAKPAENKSEPPEVTDAQKPPAAPTSTGAPQTQQKPGEASQSQKEPEVEKSSPNDNGSKKAEQRRTPGRSSGVHNEEARPATPSAGETSKEVSHPEKSPLPPKKPFWADFDAPYRIPELKRPFKPSSPAESEAAEFIHPKQPSATILAAALPEHRGAFYRMPLFHDIHPAHRPDLFGRYEDRFGSPLLPIIEETGSAPQQSTPAATSLWAGSGLLTDLHDPTEIQGASGYQLTRPRTHLYPRQMNEDDLPMQVAQHLPSLCGTSKARYTMQEPEEASLQLCPPWNAAVSHNSDLQQVENDEISSEQGSLSPKAPDLDLAVLQRQNFAPTQHFDEKDWTVDHYEDTSDTFVTSWDTIDKGHENV